MKNQNIFQVDRRSILISEDGYKNSMRPIKKRMYVDWLNPVESYVILDYFREIYFPSL